MSEEEALNDDMNPAMILEEAESALSAGDKDVAAKKFNTAGNIYMSIAEYGEAHNSFERSLKLYKEMKDDTGVSDTIYNLGVAQIHLEKWDDALKTCQEAWELFKKVSNKDGAADALYGLALASLGSGDFDGAMKYFKKARRAYKTIGNEEGVASTIMDIGAAYADKEDWEKAEKTFKKALKVYRKIEDKAGIADALSLLGDIAEGKGNQKKAAECFVEAAQCYLDAEIFEISREVVDRAEQKMWDIPKSTRRRLRRVIDDIRDNLPEKAETENDEIDEEILAATKLD